MFSMLGSCEECYGVRLALPPFFRPCPVPSWYLGAPEHTRTLPDCNLVAVCSFFSCHVYYKLGGEHGWSVHTVSDLCQNTYQYGLYPHFLQPSQYSRWLCIYRFDVHPLPWPLLGMCALLQIALTAPGQVLFGAHMMVPI